MLGDGARCAPGPSPPSVADHYGGSAGRGFARGGIRSLNEAGRCAVALSDTTLS